MSKYQEILTHIENEIQKGTWKNDILPTSKHWAEKFQVNIGTVSHVFKILKERGYTESHGRAGTKIISRKPTSLDNESRLTKVSKAMSSRFAGVVKLTHKQVIKIAIERGLRELEEEFSLS